MALIWAGHGDAVSFSDDTSLDSRHTGAKVYVNAQVIREKSLDWFYRLLALFVDVRGELKSNRVVGKFHELPESVRRAIWSSGLAAVHIHIVDPRPYQRKADEILREAWRRSDAPVLLRRRLQERDAGVNFVAESLSRYIAGSILGDSTAERAHAIITSMETPWYLSWERPVEQQVGNGLGILDAFGNKALVRKATRWAAKSSAAFHRIVDCLYDDEYWPIGVDPDFYFRHRVFRELQVTHAFDPDDQQQLAILRDVRERLLRQVAARGGRFRLLEQGGFSTVESSDSFYIQAADFAAAIARNLYSSEGLIAVASRFEYVSFNGKRVSNSDAEEEMRKATVRYA